MKYLAIVFPLILLSLIPSIYAEENVEIELVYPNGDRATINNAVLIIESANGDVQKELQGDNSEQSFFATLDTSLDYKMQVYMHDMLVSTKMVVPADFKEDVLTINIPSSVGVKFLVYYKDGTPIDGATVDLFSHDNNLIRSSNTDSKGQTLRFWISPTLNENNFYIPVVSINDDIQYTHQNLKPVSGSSEVKITTPWSSSVDFLSITAQQDEANLMTSWGSEYAAKLSGNNFEKTVLFNKGKAHFANLPVGTFDLVIYEANKPNLVWANNTISLIEESNNIKVQVIEPSRFENSILRTSSTQNPSFMGYSFLKQSDEGVQIIDSDNSVLKLETNGDNSPVFTRSTQINHDLSTGNFLIEISVDNSDSIDELLIYFTSDSFESGWYEYEIPSTLISSSPTEVIIDSNDLELTGTQNLSDIDRIQIRIRDDGTKPVTLELHNLKFNDRFESSENCNCVAFRLDDIQDFFLTNIQMELVKTFQKNNVELTVGVIANNIGRDNEMTEFVSNIANDPHIELANHGWEHEDFSQFGSVGQEMLLLRSNDKITELFGVTPSVFIPPLNAYNSDTISALHAQGFTHFSSELDFSTPPFPLSGQTLYHFPETAITGDLNADRTRFVGMSADYTFNQIQNSLDEYGFAVVTLHPQEFSQYYNNQYQNKVNYQQIEQLEILFSKINENNINTVLLSEINTKPNEKQLVPQWIKNNAQWWVEDRVSTEEFVNSLEFLISKRIIMVPDTESTSSLANIPEWIKTNIQWWTEGQTSDSEFISATQFLIKNGIIEI